MCVTQSESLMPDALMPESLMPDAEFSKVFEFFYPSSLKSQLLKIGQFKNTVFPFGTKTKCTAQFYV